MKILFNTNFNNYNTNFKARRANVSKEELTHLLNQGYNGKEIAEMLGRNQSWASTIMRNYGLQTIHASNVQKLKAVIKERLLSGYQINEIAKEFDVSPCVVYNTAVRVIGKENLAEIKEKGKNNRLQQAVDELKTQIENNEDTSTFYDTNIKGLKVRAKQAEVKLRKEVREEKGKEIAEQILDLVRKGRNVSQALRELNLKNTAGAYVDKKELKQARADGRRYKQEIIKNYIRQGYKVRQIAKEMGCTEETVYMMMGKEYRANWRKERMQNRINEILRFKDEGLSNEEIAKKMNLSISTIQRTMQNLDK